MKTFGFLLFILAASTVTAQTCITVGSECDESTDYCGPYELSEGIYRIPFADGTDVEVTNDHFNHCPRGRIDMVGTNGSSIVAAADGWIRFIEDDNSQQCDCSETFCLNNYIWMEHPNGEWTKYTHMQNNSVPNSLDAGDWVSAGTFLGTEGEVGCASGVHLHFEVAQPVDTNTLVFSEDGGYINGNWAKNVIPVFCDIAGNVFQEGEEYVAGDCSNSCPSAISNSFNLFSTGGYDADIASVSITAAGIVTAGAYSSLLYQAGDYITLGVGFSALVNSTVTARIGNCNDFPDKLPEPEQAAAEDEKAEPEKLFQLFPNPASEVVNLRFRDAEHDESAFIITNVLGRIVFETALAKGQQELVIPLSGLPAGIYQCGYFVNHQLLEIKSLSVVK